jgi:hypothetical protein
MRWAISQAQEQATGKMHHVKGMALQETTSKPFLKLLPMMMILRSISPTKKPGSYCFCDYRREGMKEHTMRILELPNTPADRIISFAASKIFGSALLPSRYSTPTALGP